MPIALTAARLLTPNVRVESPVVLMDDGVIQALGPRDAVQIPPAARLFDFPGAVLAPGYLDLHIHGAAGHDVMQPDAAGLAAMQLFLARHGVTAYLPTTMTAPVEATLRALDHLAGAIERAQREPPGEQARPLGIHMEGPFLSRAKCGAQPPEHIVAPSVELFERFWQAARGRIKLMTVAPEAPGAAELIAAAAARSVCVSVGHSDATLAETRAAIEAGARHATHTFNAMRALDHREPGILGAVLSDRRLTADLIADGVHVSPEMVALFLAAKGPDAAVLITDAISATGMGDGRFRLGSNEVEVEGNRCTWQGRLAGSVLTLDRAVRNLAQFARCDLQQAVRLASVNPARVLGDTQRGVLSAGAPADLVVLSTEGAVLKTIIAGSVP